MELITRHVCALVMYVPQTTADVNFFFTLFFSFFFLAKIKPIPDTNQRQQELTRKSKG